MQQLDVDSSFVTNCNYSQWMDIYYHTKSTYNSINLSDLGPSEVIKSQKKKGNEKDGVKMLLPVSILLLIARTTLLGIV